MPSQVMNVIREEAAAGVGKKGFLRRIAEKIGLTQREVAECKGKSLSEMAAMTSKKDVVEISANLNEIEDKIRQAGEKWYDLTQVELVDLKSKIKTCEWLQKTGELDKQIEKMRTKIKDVEDKIRFEKPWKGNPCVDGDGHGGTPDESWEHFKYRIKRMEEEDLYPLQEELSKLIGRKNNLPNEIKSLQERKNAILAEAEQLEKVQIKEIEEYKQLVKQGNVPWDAHNDRYWETFYGYRNGKMHQFNN